MSMIDYFIYLFILNLVTNFLYPYMLNSKLFNCTNIVYTNTTKHEHYNRKYANLNYSANVKTTQTKRGKQ